jgi:predicted porin
MNNKIKLAVAGAIFGAASVANAGIIIPAGEWTVDINGNVNAFAIRSDADDVTSMSGAMAQGKGVNDDDTTESKEYSINTGLLPSWLGVTGTTRQNDLDVSFTISFQPGASTTAALGGGGGTENRQAFITFGDKSWGSIKVGKDLGIFASAAILNDMTLLGVGSQGVVGTSGGTTTTLGGIGSGYMYADWKGQIAYTTPNMNGFQATVGVIQPWDVTSAATRTATTSTLSQGASQDGNQTNFGYEGQASYSWTGDVSGKVWAGFAYQDVDNLLGATTASGSFTTINGDAMKGWDVGAQLSMGNLGLVGYYYDGKGMGTTAWGANGFDTVGRRRDSDGGYLQATYVIPTGTKLGVAYGVSNLDRTAADRVVQTGTSGAYSLVEKNERWTVGAYHPLTKHLNLVAEYSDISSESMNRDMADMDQDIFSVGAILFF